jgi:Protein of unknown function (DUF3565)
LGTFTVILQAGISSIVPLSLEIEIRAYAQPDPEVLRWVDSVKYCSKHCRKMEPKPVSKLSDSANVNGTTTPARPNRKIIGFHQDDTGDWVADLECGHTRHVRHNPPWQSRPWVTTPEGRASRIGAELPCAKCVES